MKDQVIFVTGGNAGIGLATALAFAKRGSHVAILSRRPQENQVAQRYIESEGVKCLTFEGDVTHESDLKNAIDTTYEAFGRLNYAFNNAGVEQVPGPLTEQTEEDYRRIIDVNVKGVWLCMKYEIPAMLKSGGGSIVNTSSVAGVIGMAQIPLYVAAKHAVIGLTKSIALEYATQGIRVNAVCPGAVRTDLYERFTNKNPEMEKAIEGMHPMGRSGTVEEVASGVLWLCSEATWTTGQSLVLDGGFTVP
ncbi:glucose 1-dehydrogenase [Anthocerotibacter panamensis]|uniref:glucose 1-dehydrogenase n=1 Tax=Anthocerotibacter panamensis TaxID=2857077 RepID=UPI001C40266E|nr:glucose 1-dehydrogenase [Anthocerotibacter panamensis]